MLEGFRQEGPGQAPQAQMPCVLFFSKVHAHMKSYAMTYACAQFFNCRIGQFCSAFPRPLALCTDPGAVGARHAKAQSSNRTTPRHGHIRSFLRRRDGPLWGLVPPLQAAHASEDPSGGQTAWGWLRAGTRWGAGVRTRGEGSGQRPPLSPGGRATTPREGGCGNCVTGLLPGLQQLPVASRRSGACMVLGT